MFIHDSLANETYKKLAPSNQAPPRCFTVLNGWTHAKGSLMSWEVATRQSFFWYDTDFSCLFFILFLFFKPVSSQKKEGQVTFFWYDTMDTDFLDILCIFLNLLFKSVSYQKKDKQVTFLYLVFILLWQRLRPLETFSCDAAHLWMDGLTWPVMCD